VERRIGVKADEPARFSGILVDDAHGVDRLADAIVGLEIVVGRMIRPPAEIQKHRFRANDVAPFLFQAFDELRALLEDVRHIGDAARRDQQRHVAHEFVELSRNVDDNGRNAWNVVSKFGE